MDLRRIADFAFGSPKMRLAILTCFGVIFFYIIIAIGLWRRYEINYTVIGTWAGAASALFWYQGAILPCVMPEKDLLAALSNVAAAFAAAGSIAFLVPGESLDVIRATFGMG